MPFVMAGFSKFAVLAPVGVALMAVSWLDVP
jgi:hypothetical protein